MNRMIPLAVIAAAAIAASGCDRTRTNTSYNNSGTDATAAQPATPGTSTTTGNTGTTSNPAGGVGTTASSAPATPDTASPNVASTTARSDNTGAGNASGAVSETVTTGKIKAAIAADSAMKDSDISVTTKDGVVTLSGSVKSQDQVAIATNLAQRQEGVQRVESNISVR